MEGNDEKSGREKCSVNRVGERNLYQLEGAVWTVCNGDN